jgi:hypothetical protein
VKNFRSVTHPEIAPGQAHFLVSLPEKNVYLGGMSILSIPLNLELGCHNTSSSETAEKCTTSSGASKLKAPFGSRGCDVPPLSKDG